MASWVGSFSGDLEFCSNMSRYSIIFDESNNPKFPADGLTYPSSENLYHALKCIHIEDRIKFTTCSPFESKKLSRKMMGIRHDWDEVKVDAMKLVIDLKFRKTDIARMLRNLEGPIEELNNWGDKFWGKCMNHKTGKYEGQDNLGIILTNKRNELLELIKNYKE